MTELRGLPVAFRTLAYCRPKLKRQWASGASGSSQECLVLMSQRSFSNVTEKNIGRYCN